MRQMRPRNWAVLERCWPNSSQRLLGTFHDRMFVDVEPGGFCSSHRWISKCPYRTGWSFAAAVRNGTRWRYSLRNFAYVHPRFSTPTRSIYLMGGVSLLGALLMRFQLAVELLNFGAFAGFILVNLSVIRHFYLRRRERRGTAFFTNLVFPMAGALVCTYVWMSLTDKSKLVGFA